MPQRLLVLLLPFFILLGACSDDEDATVPTSPAGGATTAATEAAPEEEPVAVTGSDGEMLLLEEPPQRIVSLASHATEIFCELGAGDQLVAVELHANCPADSDAKPAVDSFQPSLEAIVDFDPDLVYVWYDPGGFVGALRGAGVPVLFIDTPEDLDGLYETSS